MQSHSPHLPLALLSSPVRDVPATHFLGDEIKDFKAEPIFETWTESPLTRAYNNARGRQLKALMKNAIKGALARGGN